MSKIKLDSLSIIMRDLYEENLCVFKYKDKVLYKNIFELSSKIDSGEYKTQYEIKFHNNSLNIYDKINNIFLYDESIENYNKKVVEQYGNFTTENIINDFNNILYDRNYFSYKNLFDDSGGFLFSVVKLHNDIYQYRKILDFPVVNKIKKLKNIPNFIFFGTLLGQHIVKVSQKVKAKNYLIIEPNLELFRLSMFTTEYKILFKNSIALFSVGENRIDSIKKMEYFITYNYLDDYIFKYYSTSYHRDNLISDFLLALQNSAHTLYDHYRQLEYIKQTTNRINKYKLLQNNEKSNSFFSKPVIILGPGPSLRKNIQFVEKNINKFILVAFSATLHILQEYNIVPDITVLVDSYDVMERQFPNNKQYLLKLKERISILATDVDKNIFKFFKKDNIFLFESIFTFSSNPIPRTTAFTVGDSTLNILLSLGFNNIYMLGTDLSIDKKTGSGYDKTHIASKVTSNTKIQNIKRIENKDIFHKDIKVKANLDLNGYVYTTDFFFRILKSYSQIINFHSDKEFKLYNLNNGAYVDGAIPKRISDVKLDKDIVKKRLKIKTLLNACSSCKLDNELKIKISTELRFLNNIIDNLKIFNKKTIIDYEQFYNFINTIVTQINITNLMFASTKRIIISYINININYITYYYNSKDIKEDKKQLNKIKYLFYKQLGKLTSDYMSYLEQV